MRLTLSDEWGYSERALAKSKAGTYHLRIITGRIGAHTKRFFCACTSMAGSYGAASAGRISVNGGDNSVTALPPKIITLVGRASYLTEDFTMSKDTQVTPASNVTYLPAAKSARKRSLLDKFADNFNSLNLQDQADVAYQIYLYYQENANRINKTNIKYLPLHGGVNYE
ncbi:hypothetical protein [Agarilytica rhodophyticola]|uniref:hypothetical protein n=1 Tax=Agarilytica rhodophyticola TaxID=1737490 RepID=UPI000B347B02|nr:hypothetical protein [Agarilytica rhodophyticola]